MTLLLRAAYTAITLSDVALGERFARAALDRGGGLGAADLLSRALLWQGRAEEVEQTLLAYSPDDLDERQLLGWGTTRVCNLYWSMGDSERGGEVLELLRARITERAHVRVVEGIRSACLLYENRLAEAVAVAEHVLADPAASPSAIAWAAVAQRALPLMGRGDDFDRVAQRLRNLYLHVDGLLRYPAAFGEIQALALTGKLDLAQRRANEYAGFSSSGQYMAWGMTKTFVGYVEVALGRLTDAVSSLEEAVTALTSNSFAAWSYPATTSLVQAYSALGQTADAERVLAATRQRFGRHIAVFDPPMRVAEAWLAAAQGTPLRAIELAHVAARAAAWTSQFAIEAEALHAAARFGDRGVAPRLAELAGRLDGRLAPLYAQHAAAVAAGDGGALDRCAEKFERLGALLSAADTAAQAATAHYHNDDRHRTAASAAATNRLAAFCGGANTPAIRAAAAAQLGERAAAQLLPLTAREREIANLIAAGRSNARSPIA